MNLGDGQETVVFKDCEAEATLTGEMISLSTMLGRADWLWDDELECHVPCCTRDVGRGYDFAQFNRCGNGPLEGDAISTGDCGQH